MKSFKQYIKEGSEYGSTWHYVSRSIMLDSPDFFLPLSSKILERALGRNRRITALHVMHPKSIPNLIKLQGSNKSISTFTGYGGVKLPIDLVKGGIAFGGGAVAEVEGDILLSYKRDAWTEIDNQGRRWFSPFNLSGSGVSGDKLKNIYKKQLVDIFYKDIISAYEKKTPEEEHGYNDYAKVNAYFEKHITKQEKAKIIKQYYDFADKLIRDQHDLILEPFFHGIGATERTYNEIVLNKIKIKKIYVYDAYINDASGGKQNETYGDFLKKNKINYETFNDKDADKIQELFDRIKDEFRGTFE